MRTTRLLAALVLAAIADAGCSSPPPRVETAGAGMDASAGVALTDQVVEAGCAMCMFGMESLGDCQTAIRVDGKVYLARGSCVPDAEDHGTGLCHAILKARVTGRLVGDTFMASSFSILP
jgi:hypothetical protein